MKIKIFLPVALLSIIVALLFYVTTVVRAEEIQLIIRGDDLGMTQGSLIAFKRAFNEGVLTCASVVVPAPWFEGASRLCRENPGWCTGIHLCLVGEWQGYRWRPVLPWSSVSSLVDEDGYFYGSPDELWARKPDLKEIDAELRAQIDLALKKGVTVHYVDTHYAGVSDYPGLENLVKKIARDYNVPVSSQIGERQCKSIYSVSPGKKLAKAVSMLESLEPGLWLWVCHPGIDSPEQDALTHRDPQAQFTNGGVGAHRAEELRTLLSPEVRAALAKKGVTLTNYRVLWEGKQGQTKQ